MWKRRIIELDWCCMRKCSEEIVDHLLIRCPIATQLWSMVYGLFGVQWIMPLSVMDMLASWQGQFGLHWNIAIW